MTTVRVCSVILLLISSVADRRKLIWSMSELSSVFLSVLHVSGCVA